MDAYELPKFIPMIDGGMDTSTGGAALPFRIIPFCGMAREYVMDAGTVSGQGQLHL